MPNFFAFDRISLQILANKSGSAVSSFCNSDPREKPLERNTIALMAPIQSLARLNQLVQIFDKTADWLRTTT